MISVTTKYYKKFKEDAQCYNIDTDMGHVYLQISWKKLRTLYDQYTNLERKYKEDLKK